MAFSSSPHKIVKYQHQQERSIACPKLYDAFISHRGPDVKQTLAKQLYELLQERGCRAFLDREEIEVGDSIPSAISNGISSSLVQIAIFSKGYAMSSWCLNELVLMLEQTDSLFIPVFYDVKPKDLRCTDRGAYAAAFSYYQSTEEYLDKVDIWEKALASAADISGYERSQYRDNLCEKIVSRVLQAVQLKEKSIPLHVAKYPVGLAELVQDFERSCLKRERTKVKIVGIFGLGGSGKTTLAKELFNRKRPGYDASCFLSDVRESYANRDLHSLQSQLFKDLFHEDRKFVNIDEGIGQLEYSLRRGRYLRFLIVLDDIDHQDQIDALLPKALVSSYSLVIITTRDQSVLTGADIRYRMKGLNRDHAKDLFCSHAFGRRDPPVAYENLVESFVEFCGGLPLSLKVLGAHVHRRHKYFWELELEKVKKIQPKDIIQRLKISFDGLDREEKQIFLDIACLFNKKEIFDLKRIAISIWNASGWSAEHAIRTLQDKCLVVLKVWRRKFRCFEMHDHLRDLGRQMADQFGPPRLWRPQYLRSMEAKGFKQILAETKGRCLHSFEDSSLKTKITYFIGSSHDSAETTLLWLDIGNEDGNLKKIPSWIPLHKLHCLTVCEMEELCSTFQRQLQTNSQASFDLRMLKIFSSPSLQNLPDLIGMFSHLEELYIERSLEKTNITSFVQSLQQLSALRSLELSGVGVSYSGNLNLSKVRDSTKFGGLTSSCMNSLESIGLFKFANISKLLISEEICPRLGSLKVEEMENLKEMDLMKLDRLNSLIVKYCPELELITGLSSLTGLQSLKVGECYKLETISGLSSLKGLQSLDVWRCPKLETISGLSSLTRLQVLWANACDDLKSLPTLAHLRGLERIHVGQCHQLQSIQGLEELQGLKSLVIGVPDNGDASVWNCIYGLKMIPSEYTILTGKPVDSSRLNINLFSEMNGVHLVDEIERGRKLLKMRSSSNAITIYVSIIRGEIFPFEAKLDGFHPLKYNVLSCRKHRGEWMVTALFSAHDSFYFSIGGVTIEKGFKATLKKGEEGKALTILQRIVDQLYIQSILGKL